MTLDVDNLLAADVGRRIPGGCLDCDAYQTVHRDGHGIWHVTVHPDDTCPL